MFAIYNTLTRKKEKFKPIKKGKVGMYVCGPTVYDHPHIGHIRSAYVFDVIRKYMEYTGLEVCFVRNVTDIDDKIINRSSKEITEAGEKLSFDGLKRKTREVSSLYLKIYHDALKIFGITSPTIEPKATENIERMITFVQSLIDKDYAYSSGGDVYFSVNKFKGYGKLSNQDQDQMVHGARVEPDKKKKDQLDFALWKEAKPGEPFWESPWGKGRPGWHIECSVMSTNILGDQFDIHGGGLDLIFPHHENEIAQAEAATGGTFANYWIHNGLLTVNGEKMAKSLENYITVSSFLDKYKDPDILKLAFLNSHYRSPMDYTEDKMKSNVEAKDRIIGFVTRAEKFIGEKREHLLSKQALALRTDLDTRFKAAMDDDINTPLALAVIFDAVKMGNDIISDSKSPEEEKRNCLYVLMNFIWKCGEIFKLSLKVKKTNKEDEDKICILVKEREQARNDKDFKKADEIREKLLSGGVEILDTQEGTVWRKK